MKVQKHYAGDVDSTLRKLQERTGPDCIELLYRLPREQYIAEVESSQSRAGKLFDVLEDKLFHAIEDKTTFDHEILLPAYDRLAAQFRFKSGDVWQTSLFGPSGLSDMDPSSRIQQIEQDWLEFYRDECGVIAGQGEMARAVLNAVGFAGKDRGEDALQALLDLLDKRYRGLTRARDRWGQFQEMREFCDW